MIDRAGLLIAMLVSASNLHAADPAKPPADPDKPICRSENPTGSRARVKKICLTREQWDKLSQETQKGMNDISRSASRIPQSGSIMTGN